jgi:hypothetical protein
MLAHFHPDQAIVIDRIMRSSEQLRVGNQTKYLRMEQTVFDALCELWPQSRRRKALRVVAMVSVGALRLALDAWSAEEGKKPVSKYLKESFDILRAEL